MDRKSRTQAKIFCFTKASEYPGKLHRTYSMTANYKVNYEAARDQYKR